MALSRSWVVTWLAFTALTAGAVMATLISCSPDRGAEAPSEMLASTAPDLDAPVREAIDAARRAVDDSPGSGDAWGHLGMLLQVHGLHGESHQAYRKAASLAPSDPRWPHLTGIVCELLSRPEEAATAYERAVELNGRDLVALSSWARILQDRGEDDRARQLYLRALNVDRQAVAARVGLGQLAARAGQDEIAEKSFKLALEAFPRCGPAHTELARIYGRRGDDARATYHRRWSQDLPGKLPLPDPLMDEVQELGVSYSARMKRAELAVRRGHLERAEENYRAAVSLREALAEPRYRLGLTLSRLDKAGEAVEQLRAAKGLQGSSWRVDALVELSAMHAQRKRWVEAEQALDEALEIESDAARVLVQRGKLRFLQRHNDDALAEFDRAIALHPDEVDAYLEKGALLLLEGKTSASKNLPEATRKEIRCRKTRQALDTLDRALQLRVDQATAYDLAGSARMVLRADCEDRPEERARLLAQAIDNFSALVACFPSRRKGYLQLVRALVASGDSQRAQEYLRRARVRWPEDARFRVARDRSQPGSR